jgi:predicted MFS family arabinose efflux permease
MAAYLLILGPVAVPLSLSLPERTHPNTAPAVTPALTFLLSLAASVIVANLFMSQPIVAQIARSFGSTQGSAGVISMLTMLGYAAGVVFVLPLVDKLRSRRLILCTLLAAVLALLTAACAPSTFAFLCAAFLVGATSCVVQMFVVTAAQLSPDAVRGRTVGTVMSGLMLGILLSRPVGSFIAGEFGWRTVYAVSAGAAAVLTLLLWRFLPESAPPSPRPYLASLVLLWPLLTREPVLRRRAAYQSLLMVAFSVFWTAVAWRLAQPPFSLGTRGIAVFALAGAGGAVIAPVAGRAGDRGQTRAATLWAHGTVIAAVLLAAVVGGPWQRVHIAKPPNWVLLGLLAAAALLLDFGTIADQALGRRAINMVRQDARGSINGLFTGIFFVGGAIGSALAGPAWAAAGWVGVCGVALCASVLAIALRLRETREHLPTPIGSDVATGI